MRELQACLVTNVPSRFHHGIATPVMGILRTQFVIARSERAWPSQYLAEHSLGNEIATLRSQWHKPYAVELVSVMRGESGWEYSRFAASLGEVSGE